MLVVGFFLGFMISLATTTVAMFIERGYFDALPDAIRAVAHRRRR